MAVIPFREDGVICRQMPLSPGTVHVLPEVGILYHEISVDTLSLGA